MNKAKLLLLLLLLLLLCFSGYELYCQPYLADQVVAVVGKSAILQSDIETQYIQLQAQKTRFDGNAKCTIFEDLLVQKLLLDQAQIDSIAVSDDQVKVQVDARIKYFMDYFGEQVKMEEYFKKSIFDMKDDMFEMVKEQMITQQMRSKIIEDVTITPSEVKEFYQKLPADSIPEVNTNIEYCQIVLYPPFQEKSLFELRQRMLDLRKRIIDGEKFSTLARLYSEDQGSARQGGEIGFLSRGELDQEYGRVAFGLKVGAVSTIVESNFGLHIIQLIERRGDKVNTRHILMKPKAKPEEIQKALQTLDSIVKIIKTDTVTFEEAAKFFSEDKMTRMSGGNVVNPEDNSLRHSYDQLPPADLYTIKKLKPGEISEPIESLDENGKQVFKVIKLKSKSEPHKANTENDYELLQNMMLDYKKQEVFNKWLIDKQKEVNMELIRAYANCTFTTIKPRK